MASSTAEVVETKFIDDALESRSLIGIARDIDLDSLEFVPWDGRFLVERFAAETETPGGIALPEQAVTKKAWGKVVKLPENNPPNGVSIGDIVVFMEGCGVDMDHVLGDQFVLLDSRDDFDNDVLGVFREKG